ncbi:MAG: glycosyltransferase family 4 protein [Euryarchaeota archaeon]|nr:glycosyltransferase family 4 protein [Euryarchaeota archaeon]
MTNALPNTPKQHTIISPHNTIYRIGPNDRSSIPYQNHTISKVSFPFRLIGDLIRYKRKISKLENIDYDLLHVHFHLLEQNLLRFDRWLKRPFFTKLINFTNIKKPKIATVHGLSTLHNMPKIDMIIKWYENNVISQFDNIICVDKNIYNYILKLNQNAGNKVWFVPNAVDTDLFSFSQLITNDRLKIGFVGRLELSRGLPLLSQFIENLPQYVELTVVGAGNQIAINKFRAHNKINQVKFIQNVPNNKMPEMYKSFDILFNPVSIEGISRATLEAMSCGRPVMMIEKGDRYPVIDRKTGFLIQDDIQDLLKVLDEIHVSKDQLIEMSKTARAVIDAEYNSTVVLKKVSDIYNELILSS